MLGVDKTVSFELADENGAKFTVELLTNFRKA